MAETPREQLRKTLTDLFATAAHGPLVTVNDREHQERLGRLQDLTSNLLAFVEGGNRNAMERGNS
jgi:hypothetical protein